MLRDRPFTKAERWVAWAFAIALIGAGIFAIALSLMRHQPRFAVASLGAIALGALWARAAMRARPL